MMKNILKITLGLVAGLFMLVACSDSDDAAPAAFSLDKEDITVAAEGGKESIMVNAVGEWSVSSSAAWVQVTPANGIGAAMCEVVVDSSIVNGLREASLRVVSGVDTKIVTINQTGFAKAITPKEKDIEIESSAAYDERYFETTVTTNVEFKVEFNYASADADWLSAEDVKVELDYGARPRTVKLHFDWKMNTEPVERVAQISLVPVSSADEISEPAVITVRQKAAVKIEDTRAGDSIALITISELLNCWGDTWDTGERMNNWEGVTLWEATDEELPCPEAVGRVRSASYSFFETKESLPKQIKHLKYLESLHIMSNVNTMLLSIDLGPEICELDYLKELEIFSYGITTLPQEFVNLGKSLEVLDLSANNFTEIPSVLTPENFPKLKTLRMVGSRRWTTSDLTKKDNYDNGVGLNFMSYVTNENDLRRLFLWENLEELRLSNCYIEGELPDFTVGQEGVVAYTQADVDAFGGDTIQWLADNKMPKILPNMELLSINLNFFTGELPKWLLYHPRLLDWFPDLLIYNQQEGGINSAGEKVGFTNAPSNNNNYYEAFPKMEAKYELKEDIEEDDNESDDETSNDEHCDEEDSKL
ncbi:MAG: hypothetical protein IJX41_04620 [Bacteroidaceae bacterium]|nr:hypothetical protein [Bacteroidaceae bacterium]